MAEGGLSTRRPIFIVGLPRSGTTLIEQVLASHPQVYGAGSCVWPGGRSTRSPRSSAVPGRRSIASKTSTQGRSASSPSSTSVGSKSTGVAATTGSWDKMPDNYLQLGLLTAMFPEATFIHARRDLRDVAVSCLMTDFRSIRWASDPAHLASRFQASRRLWRYWEASLVVPVHAVDYEDLVSDLEGVAHTLLDACGLDGTPPAWNSIGPSARFGPPASPKSVSRSTQGLLLDGGITKDRTPNCSRRSPSKRPSRSNHWAAIRPRRPPEGPLQVPADHTNQATDRPTGSDRPSTRELSRPLWFRSG